MIQQVHCAYFCTKEFNTTGVQSYHYYLGDEEKIQWNILEDGLMQDILSRQMGFITCQTQLLQQ